MKPRSFTKAQEPASTNDQHDYRLLVSSQRLGQSPLALIGPVPSWQQWLIAWCVVFGMMPWHRTASAQEKAAPTRTQAPFARTT